MQCLHIASPNTHSVMSAWWEPTGIPTRVPVAAVFQLAENKQTVTIFARMRKIDLNVRDPVPEAEELVANRAAAHMLTKQNDECIKAGHQRDVQRLWELWCEGAEAQLHERAQ